MTNKPIVIALLHNIKSFITLLIRQKIYTDLLDCIPLPFTIVSPYRNPGYPHDERYPAIFISQLAVRKLAIRADYQSAYRNLTKGLYPCSPLQETYFSLFIIKYHYLYKFPQYAARAPFFTACADTALSHTLSTLIAEHISIPFIIDGLQNKKTRELTEETILVLLEREIIYPLYRYGTFNSVTYTDTPPPIYDEEYTARYRTCLKHSILYTPYAVPL
jgi:hypothetical protein